MQNTRVCERDSKKGIQWSVLFALVVAECSSGFEATMIYSALPSFIEEFDDPVAVGWLVTIFLLVSASVAAVASRLGDIYGRRRVLLLVMVLALGGSLFSALSDSLGWVLVGRGIQGISAAMLPLCIGLVRENFEPSVRPLAVGIILASASIAAGAGLVAGGYIVDNYNWHGIFYCSAILAGLGWLAVWLFVPHSKPAELKEPIDIVGALLFIPPVAGLLYTLSNITAWGFFDTRTLGLLTSSGLLLILWCFYELRHKEPMINVRLLADRQIALTNISMILLGLGGLQLYLVFSIFLQQPLWTGAGLGLAAAVAGTVMLPSQLVGVFSAPFSGWIASRYSARHAAIVGIMTMLLAYGSLMIHHTGFWYMATTIIAAAMGLSIVYAAIPNLIVEVVPEDRTSEATGLVQVLRSAASAVGTIFVTLLLGVYTITDTSDRLVEYPSQGSYVLVFGYIFSCNVAMLLAVLAIPKRNNQANSDR